MFTCSSIPPEIWVKARKVLVFYFSRRHGSENAQDLAQDVLTAMLSRTDYVLEQESDFLGLCYGFAVRISLAEFRRHARRPHTGTQIEVAVPDDSNSGGLNSIEARIYADQIERIGQTEMPLEDWRLIQKSFDSDRAKLAEELGLGNANNARVKLFRAFSKLRNLLRSRELGVTDRDSQS